MENAPYLHHPDKNLRSNLGLRIYNERSGPPLSVITFRANLDILLLITFFKILAFFNFIKYEALYFTLKGPNSLDMFGIIQVNFQYQ